MTKTRARYSYRLGSTHYAELMRQETVSDIASYLRKSTRYRSALAALPEQGFPRQELEECLHYSIWDYVRGVLHYDRSPDSFYHYIFREMEVGFLIHCLDTLNHHSGQSISLTVPAQVAPYIKINMAQLAKASSFRELLLNLRGTAYHTVLSPWSGEDDTPFDHLACEAALRSHNISTTLQSIAALPSAAERQTLRQYYSRLTELDNLQVIFRLKALPTVTVAKLQAMLSYLPDGYFQNSEWHNLLQSPTQNSFLETLQPTALGKRLGDLKSTTLLGSSYFGLLTAGLQHKLSQNLLRFAREGASAYMALVMMNRLEVKNLIALVEGAHYRLPSEELAVLLVF
ncbi:MAG: V-type ATPase subunit [Symbiobacteriaceae bacterium]|nr:V-type ATPase subunit [Symbiobacteriaceae bacterium]